MERSAEEIREIERHKYFLSEKHGHDVGWDFAAEDWDRQHRERWQCEQTAACASNRESVTVKSVCCEDSSSEAKRADGEMKPVASTPTAAARSCCSESNPVPASTTPSATVVRKDTTSHPADRGPLRWLLSRLFQQSTS